MENLIVRSRKDIIVYCVQHDILVQDFNEPVTIAPNADVEGLFNSCTSFNQPVIIPAGTIKSCRAMFFRCKSFNQSVIIPTGVTNCEAMFMNCESFNQPIIIPEGVEDCNNMFANCTSFDQKIVIPASVNNLSSMFANCVNLNSPISILPKINQLTKRTASHMLYRCLNFNTQICFEDISNIEYMFDSCESFNQSICINSTVKYALRAFARCKSFNSPVTIYMKLTSQNDNHPFDRYMDMFNGCDAFKQKVLLKIDGTMIQAIMDAPKNSSIEFEAF